MFRSYFSGFCDGVTLNRQMLYILGGVFHSRSYCLLFFVADGAQGAKGLQPVVERRIAIRELIKEQAAFPTESLCVGDQMRFERFIETGARKR